MERFISLISVGVYDQDFYYLWFRNDICESNYLIFTASAGVIECKYFRTDKVMQKFYILYNSKIYEDITYDTY